MNANELIKQMLISFSNNDKDEFYNSAKAYIDREKRMKHTQVANELERVLFDNSSISSFSERRFKSNFPIPRDNEKGFPLLEIKQYSYSIEDIIISKEILEQIENVIREFKDSDILASYNLSYTKKILLCGKPGTGKTFTAKIVSSVLDIPIVYIRFDSIISSYLGETATNLKKVFDFINIGTWIVLFDEFDVIGKNRDDIHEHGEIKRVVNNFLQMLDNYSGSSILIAATNHQHLLDSAIWRRFDDVIFYDLPNCENRMKLFEMFLRPIKKEDNLDYKKIAQLSEKLSPSDIKMITEKAMKRSIILNKSKVTNNDLMDCLNSFLKRQNLHKI